MLNMQKLLGETPLLTDDCSRDGCGSLATPRRWQCRYAAATIEEIPSECHGHRISTRASNLDDVL